MIPGCLLYLALAAGFPEVLASAVPSDYLMQRLDLPWLRIVFYVVVFGTLVETATAFIHAANERIAGGDTERGKVMPPWLRAVVALPALLFAVTLASQIGLIDLIAKVTEPRPGSSSPCSFFRCAPLARGKSGSAGATLVQLRSVLHRICPLILRGLS
jgi:hypothetical protein